MHFYLNSFFSSPIDYMFAAIFVFCLSCILLHNVVVFLGGELTGLYKLGFQYVH